MTSGSRLRPRLGPRRRSLLRSVLPRSGRRNNGSLFRGEATGRRPTTSWCAVPVVSLRALGWYGLGVADYSPQVRLVDADRSPSGRITRNSEKGTRPRKPMAGDNSASVQQSGSVLHRLHLQMQYTQERSAETWRPRTVAKSTGPRTPGLRRRHYHDGPWRQQLVCSRPMRRIWRPLRRRLRLTNRVPRWREHRAADARGATARRRYQTHGDGGRFYIQINQRRCRSRGNVLPAAREVLPAIPPSYLSPARSTRFGIPSATEPATVTTS